MKVVIAGEYPAAALAMMQEKLAARKDLFDEVKVIPPKAGIEELEGVDCLVWRIFKVTGEEMKKLPALKFIQKWGAGYDSIDIETAGSLGIRVSNTPGANAFSVAETAVMLMLGVYRNLIPHYEQLRQGVWTKGLYMDRMYSLRGKTVGLLGCGNVGREVAKRVRAFGAKVCYYDIFRMSEEAERENEIAFVSFEELLRTADVVSIHLPLTDETHNMIDAPQLAMMKSTAILINTARGGIVNEDALCQALLEGKILGAGLDCLAHEPVQPGEPILRAPNVLYTPHIGGVSVDLNEVIVPMITDNLIRFAETGEAQYVVNRQYLRP